MAELHVQVELVEVVAVAAHERYPPQAPPDRPHLGRFPRLKGNDPIEVESTFGSISD